MIVLTAILASGCAAAGYEPGALQQHLVDLGVAPARAKCVVDRMTDEFGDTRLGARADASAAEVKAERAVLARCGVGATRPR